MSKSDQTNSPDPNYHYYEDDEDQNNNGAYKDMSIVSNISRKEFYSTVIGEKVNQSSSECFLGVSKVEMYVQDGITTVAWELSITSKTCLVSFGTCCTTTPYRQTLVLVLNPRQDSVAVTDLDTIFQNPREVPNTLGEIYMAAMYTRDSMVMVSTGTHHPTRLKTSKTKLIRKIIMVETKVEM